MNIKLLFLFSLSFILSSCGPASEYVDVTLLTPIGMNHSFRSLQENISKSNFLNEMMLFSAPSGYCRQNNILIGTNEYVGSNQIVTKKFDIYSDYANCSLSSAPQTSDYITCLKNAYLETQPVIQVARGKLVDIGIAGAFYPAAQSNGINCLTSEGAAIASTASVIGHQKVNLTEATTINLNVWVINSTESPVNSPGKKEFIQILELNTAYTALLGVRYFHSAKGEAPVYQNLQDSANYHYIPHLFPLLVYYNESGTVKSQFITGPNQTIGNSGYEITFTEI